MAMLVSLEMKNEEESDEGNLSDQKVNWVQMFYVFSEISVTLYIHNEDMK